MVKREHEPEVVDKNLANLVRQVAMDELSGLRLPLRLVVAGGQGDHPVLNKDSALVAVAVIHKLDAEQLQAACGLSPGELNENRKKLAKPLNLV